MEGPTVLIISDEVDFGRRIAARWQLERNAPAFTVLSGDLWPRFAVDAFDVAIVGELRRELLSVVLEPLHSTGQPIFCVCPVGTYVRCWCGGAGRESQYCRARNTGSKL